MLMEIQKHARRKMEKFQERQDMVNTDGLYLKFLELKIKSMRLWKEKPQFVP